MLCCSQTFRDNCRRNCHTTGKSRHFQRWRLWKCVKYGAGQERTSPALTRQFTTGEMQWSELGLQGEIIRSTEEGKNYQSSGLLCRKDQLTLVTASALAKHPLPNWKLGWWSSSTSCDHLFQWLIAFIFTKGCSLFFKSIFQIFFLWIHPNQ